MVKSFYIQVESFLFKLSSESVCVCGGAILVCLYLVLLEIFEIIKKHLGHRQCLLSLNNSLLFFFK